MILILAALALAAVYSGAMWLYVCVLVMRDDLPPGLTTKDAERHTFHLGLCFILAIGFLGVLLEIG